MTCHWRRQHVHGNLSTNRPHPNVIKLRGNRADIKLTIVNLSEEATNMHLIHSTYTQCQEVPQESLNYQMVDLIPRVWPTWLRAIGKRTGELTEYSLAKPKCYLVLEKRASVVKKPVVTVRQSTNNVTNA
jgi:hypothetical protein